MPEPEQQKTTGMVPYSLSMTRELMREIDSRAKSLGLNRSQYFAALALNDLKDKGPMTLHPAATEKRRKRARVMRSPSLKSEAG